MVTKNSSSSPSLSSLRTKKLPESFVVAPDGTVVAKVNGGVTADELERLIDDR